MKLFNLHSYADVDAFSSALGAAHVGVVPTVWPDPYPTAEEGIELSPDRKIWLAGDLKVPVAEDLLNSTDPAVIRRERNSVVLLQGSVEKLHGTTMIVPPKSGGDNLALAKLNLSGYPFVWIRYQPTDAQLVARLTSDDGFPDERLLACIAIGEPLKAQRIDQKWLFFGEERIREFLTIRFDGRTISFDSTMPKVKSFWQNLFG